MAALRWLLFRMKGMARAVIHRDLSTGMLGDVRRSRLARNLSKGSNAGSACLHRDAGSAPGPCHEAVQGS